VSVHHSALGCRRPQTAERERERREGERGIGREEADLYASLYSTEDAHLDLLF
jgi:hypothetical protein